MNKFTNTAAIDPINNIELVSANGGLILKITRVSCKTGYVTQRGISGDINNAFIFSPLDITVDTFADLQAYDFKPGIPVEINVVNDENKGQENTSYNWTGSVLKWNAEVEDAYQPTI